MFDLTIQVDIDWSERWIAHREVAVVVGNQRTVYLLVHDADDGHPILVEAAPDALRDEWRRNG